MSRRLLLLLLISGCQERPEWMPPPATPDAGPDAAPPTEEPVIVQCPTPVPPPTDGLCDVTAGAPDRIAVRGDVLAPEAIYADGAVTIEGDEIRCVGCDCDLTGATVIACAGAAISPGLINAHDHLTFTEGDPIDHGTTRYDHRHDWRGTLPAPANPHGTGGSSAGTRWGEVRMLLSGVTAMAGSGRRAARRRRKSSLVHRLLWRYLSA